MAQLLSEDRESLGHSRRRLHKEHSSVSEDLLGRLNALDFVNSVVGEATDVPEILGDYRITGLLGRGGMGTVYQAYQESLEREVALKVLSPVYSADPTMRQRFRSEARATASLHHQHIVPIYDYGEAGGCLFFAMEKVDGISLDKHISTAGHRGQPLMEPREAARQFAGVADALGHAHKRRLLHRDVKPGNILVQADGTLALADFGLSKVLGEASVHLTSKGGGFLGTLHYAAPEQALGQDLTPASDLYALGVTMFEAITGELPITGKSTESILQSILHGTRRRLRDCMQRAPKDMEAVLAKLLSRDPQDRYDDGELLARDLLRVAEGEPVRIRRQPIAVRVWRRARKNPGLSAALAIAAILLIVTFALLQWIWTAESLSRESRHENLLTQAMNGVRTELGPAAGPPGLFAGMTGLVPPEEPPTSSMIDRLQQARKLLPDDPTAAEMERAYREDPRPSATDFLRVGRGYEALQKLDQAIESMAGSRDSPSELRLYQLYLSRAVANLTRSVSRMDDAGKDLARAAMLRPGAFFSQLLIVVTEWEIETGASVLLQRLEDLLDSAPSGGDTVIGGLLLSLADIRPDADATLMEFEIPYRDRRALHLRAVELLGVLPAGSVLPGTPTGLAARLAGHAREALENIGDQFARDQALDAGWAILTQSLVPESPLQAWGVVFEFLKDQNNRSVVRLPTGEEMSGPLQIRGWLALLGLEPSAGLLELAGNRVSDLRNAYGELKGLIRLDAVFHQWNGTGPDAFEAAHKWVQNDPDNPEAVLCRIQARLRIGDLEYVGSDGAWAVIVAADREEVNDRILEMLRDAAENLYADDPERQDELRAMARAFGGGTS
jgi:hypothetical protein